MTANQACEAVSDADNAAITLQQVIAQPAALPDITPQMLWPYFHRVKRAYREGRLPAEVWGARNPVAVIAAWDRLWAQVPQPDAERQTLKDMEYLRGDPK